MSGDDASKTEGSSEKREDVTHVEEGEEEKDLKKAEENEDKKEDKNEDAGEKKEEKVKEKDEKDKKEDTKDTDTKKDEKEKEKEKEKEDDKKTEEKTEKQEEKQTEQSADPDDYNPEEEVTEGNWTTPQVVVEEVKTVSGEEDEDVFWSHRAKLYRWREGEWKERGVGDAKLLQHKESKKLRFLLRQDKTLKVVANHYVVAKDTFCKLTPNVGSDKIWVWAVTDSSEDEPKLEQFALKFGQVEQAKIFKEKFEEACKLNEDKFVTK